MTKAKLYFTVGDPQEINDLEVPNLSISGISTLGVTSTSNLTSQNISVSGISTLGVTSTTNLTTQDILVSGIATLGVTSTSNLTTQNISVSGITTISNGPVLIGSAVSTGSTTQLLQVTGDSYISGSLGIGTTTPTSNLQVIGNALFTGITTVGLGTTSTPPSNYQLSFELTSNTNLRIKVRGSDGVLRTTNFTLA